MKKYGRVVWRLGLEKKNQQKKKVNIRRKKVDNGTMLVNGGLKVDVSYNIDNSSPRLGAK